MTAIGIVSILFGILVLLTYHNEVAKRKQPEKGKGDKRYGKSKG